MAESQQGEHEFMVAGLSNRQPAETADGIAIVLVDARGGRVRLHLSTGMAELLGERVSTALAEGEGTGQRGYASRGPQLQQRRVTAGSSWRDTLHLLPVRGPVRRFRCRARTLPDLRGRAAVRPLGRPGLDGHAGHSGARSPLAVARRDGVTGIGIEPAFAIGQRAMLIEEPDGCVLWDCTSLVTPGIVQAIGRRGGLKADRHFASAFLRRHGRMERGFRRRSDLSSCRRPPVGHAAEPVNHLLGRRHTPAVGCADADPLRRAFRRRPGAALGERRGGREARCLSATSPR